MAIPNQDAAPHAAPHVGARPAGRRRSGRAWLRWGLLIPAASWLLNVVLAMALTAQRRLLWVVETQEPWQFLA